MSYRVDVLPRAAKSLRRLPARERDRVAVVIFALSHTPRPPGVKKLTGASTWRLRVGEYRVLYEIDDQEELVIVTRIERRTTTTYVL